MTVLKISFESFNIDMTKFSYFDFIILYRLFYVRENSRISEHSNKLFTFELNYARVIINKFSN